MSTLSITSTQKVFSPGSLVKARGREWVVLPDSDDEMLILRPLGSGDSETAGILRNLEPVEEAVFTLPDPQQAGDHFGARLLADAALLGFRSSAGPFRSFGQISVEPRPYQLVPLMMALNLDPVRLLIADDVGIGKTIEAGLIAKEMLTTGQAKSFCVLCPPHLAEQWQSELSSKFHIDAELVLSSTINKLERSCQPGETVFEVFPYTIVSTDFIKAQRRREEFTKNPPDLILVDEAHTCATDTRKNSSSHQRYELLRDLAANWERHIILITATPHSGNEGAFRSLIGLLHPDFSTIDSEENIVESTKKKLAKHFIQRRRSDIAKYLATETPFPTRLELAEKDGGYQITEQYQQLQDEILSWARGIVSDESVNRQQQRVRWWSVLSLLRSLSSSPAALAATLRTRAASALTTTAEEADEVGMLSVLDQDDAEDAGYLDVTPGANPEIDESAALNLANKTLEGLAKKAELLKGTADNKLSRTVKLLRKLVEEEYNTIVFCRFIHTADYVAEHLRKTFGDQVTVESVTGMLPTEEREERIAALGQVKNRILVATDCLSEGINLQEYFNAVVHYDLPWNPTRLEQREGRVDRYGQASQTVKVATIYCTNNTIDELIMNVLLRKHRAIRSELGISIPVPGSNDMLIEHLSNELLFENNRQLSLLAAPLEDTRENIVAIWENAANKEKASPGKYAQNPISPEEVEKELKSVQNAIGSNVDVARFVRNALTALGCAVEGNGMKNEPMKIKLANLPETVRDVLNIEKNELACQFQPITQPGVIYIPRTHPLVNGLSSYLLDSALDQYGDKAAARCGAIRTKDVKETSTLLLIRNRFELTFQKRDPLDNIILLAEELSFTGFSGSPEQPRWLSSEDSKRLLELKPSANMTPEQKTYMLQRVIEQVNHLMLHLEQQAKELAIQLADTHQRVRRHNDIRSKIKITPQLPLDIIGLYLFLPAGN